MREGEKQNTHIKKHRHLFHGLEHDYSQLVAPAGAILDTVE